MTKLFVLLPLTAVLLAGCSTQMSATPTATPMASSTPQAQEPETMPIAQKDLVDVAMGSPDHTTLVTAVKAAGLVETLKGAGPFTVFAPTNAAFAKLPAATVNALLKPEMKADLTKILTYHVIPGAVRSTDLESGMKVKTVQGQELTITQQGSDWMLTDATGKQAKITAADLTASNGVIHVIDTVVMPK